MDKARDRSRPFRTFSPEGLKHWRRFRKVGKNAKAKCQAMGVCAFGLPTIAVIRQSEQTTDNCGGDTTSRDCAMAECSSP